MSMPTYHITIADKIKTYRSENNLSLKEFASWSAYLHRQSASGSRTPAIPTLSFCRVLRGY